MADLYRTLPERTQRVGEERWDARRHRARSEHDEPKAAIAAPAESPHPIADDARRVYGVVFGALFARIMVVLLGLGAVELSWLVPLPLPSMHDDPGRVEPLALLLLTGYGIVGAGLLAARSGSPTG